MHPPTLPQRAEAPAAARSARVLARVSPFALLVASALAAGTALRVWILASPLGGLDSDEAIVGLMARHALEGELNVFYWLNFYGGSQEPLLTAAVFGVVGSSVLALKLVTVAIFAVAGVVLWFVGRRTVGERAAWLGVALYWTWPAWFVWWTTKSRGFYGVALLCELLVLLLVLRLRERDSRRDVLCLGFVLGFGVWASYQFLLLGLPALAWLVWRRPSVLRSAWLAVPAFVAGAAPWLVWNATNDWKGVIPKSVAGQDTSYLDRFVDLFTLVLPTWLGLRVPHSLDWIGGAAAAAVAVAAVAGFLVLVVRRPRRYELLVVAGAAFPLVYAASTYTYLTDEPRYLVFLAPVTALLVGRLASHRRAAYVVLPAALGLTVVGLVRLEDTRELLTTPPDLGPALAVLEREGATRVLADYWIAYRISFESGERIVATSTGFVRYQPHDRLVRSSRDPARVFAAGGALERAARARLVREGFRRVPAGRFVVYVRPQRG